MCREGAGSSWCQDALVDPGDDKSGVVINCAKGDWPWHQNRLRFLLNLRMQNRVQM
jgi:hypothetical protein